MPVMGILYLEARATGLEPATSSVTGKRSNQLSYARIFLGIFLIYAFYIVRLQDRFGTNLGCAQGRRSIGGKIRTAGASRKDDHSPLFQMPERATADKRLAHVKQRNLAHHTRGKTTLSKRTLERPRIA